MLVACAQQVTTIYCESHESVAEIKAAGDWSLSGIECVGGLSPRVFIDPAAWKVLTNSAAGFGYQVVQRQSE